MKDASRCLFKAVCFLVKVVRSATVIQVGSRKELTWHKDDDIGHNDCDVDIDGQVDDQPLQQLLA